MSLQKFFGDLYFKTKERAENKFILKDIDPDNDALNDVVKSDFLPAGEEKLLEQMSIYELLEVLDKNNLNNLFDKLEELDNEGYFDFKSKGTSKLEDQAIKLAVNVIDKNYTDPEQMHRDLYFLNAVRQDELARGVLTSVYIRNAFFASHDIFRDNPRAGSVFIDDLKRKLEEVKEKTGSNKWDEFSPEEMHEHFSKDTESILNEASNITFDIERKNPSDIINNLKKLDDVREKEDKEEEMKKNDSG